MTHPSSGTVSCDLRGAGFSLEESARIHAVQPSVQLAALTWGVPPWEINGTIWVESRFHPYATSSAGAKGLMQVMDATGEEVARQNGLLPWRPFDVEKNIMVGTAFLSLLRNAADKMLVYREAPTTDLVAQWGFLPTVWQLVHGGYFAGMAGIRNMAPGTKVHGQVMRYIEAVGKAVERFRGAAQYCEGRPDWAEAPAPTTTRPRRNEPVRGPSAPLVAHVPQAAGQGGGGAGVLILAAILLGGMRW